MAYLKSSNSQERLRAIAELRHHEAGVAVPLLKSKIHDKEFIVRSLVAMGLGKKQTEESFSALLEMIKVEPDPNVRAEAANSLSLFGQVAISYLVETFYENEHWLIRCSILAALLELNCPAEIFDVCICAIKSQDPIIQESSIEALGFLAGTSKQNASLELLLSLVDAQHWCSRMQVAKALRKFNQPQAKEALIKLSQDEDHRVVGSASESLTQI